MINTNPRNITIPLHLISTIARIESFNGSWKTARILVPDKLSNLKYSATIESIGSSTRIEGVTLTNIEIETFLKNLKINSLKTRDEEEIAGYAEVMDLIFTASDSIDISENHIKQLHSMLLKFTKKDVAHRGLYKTSINSVGAFENGTLKAIIFETASPFETPFLMEKLIRWYDMAIKKDWHPLVIIGIFIVTFLAIHPFQDGNGRLSRILTTIMLLKHGYDYVPYASLEKLVEENKNDYYSALQKTQLTLAGENNDYLPWLSFFFKMLEAQTKNLEKRIKQQITLQDLPKVSGDIMELFETNQQLSLQDCMNLLGISRNTIRKHLYSLVRDKKLISRGDGRGVFYIKA